MHYYKRQHQISMVSILLNRINRTAPDGCNPLADSGVHPNQSLSRKRFFPYLRAPGIPKPLKNDHGEANYFSTVVFIFIAVLLLAFAKVCQCCAKKKIIAESFLGSVKCYFSIFFLKFRNMSLHEAFDFPVGRT